VEVVIVPPFTALAKVSEALGGTETIKIGAQNMYWEKSGAFTGEISAAMLRDLFVRYVVLGHSERRALLGETDEIVNRKVRAAHEASLRPIVCIGETLDQREAGDVRRSSARNSAAASRISARRAERNGCRLRAVWAIGTGKTRARARHRKRTHSSAAR
jgi:triosephosphate isomerase